MRKSWIAPCAALLLGVCGGMLRKNELNSIFDAGNGISLYGTKESFISVAFSAAVVVALVIFSILATKSQRSPKTFKKAFGTVHFASFALSAVLGLAAAAGGVLLLISRTEYLVKGIALWVFILFAVATGISMIVMAVTSFTQKEGSSLCLASVIPALFFCYWLVLLYRENAGNPVLLDYCYGCFAFAAASLSFYYIAGFAYGRRKTGATLCFSLAAIYLLTVTLADGYPMALNLVIAGTIGFLILGTIRFLGSMERYETEEAAPENTQE